MKDKQGKRVKNKAGYVPLRVSLLQFSGVIPSLVAMRLPKKSTSDSTTNACGRPVIGPKDAKLAAKLIRAGDDHGKFARGISAHLKLEMQAGWMMQFDTYRVGIDTLSTSSAMHNELKGLRGEELATQKQRDLSLKIYTRITRVSYQTLRNIYLARRCHRHPDWSIFCHFVKGLPFFDQLIYPESRENIE